MNTLLYLAEAFIVAYIMLIISHRIKLPSVSAFVIGGVILGGSLFYWFPLGKTLSENWLFTGELLNRFSIITQIALGIIAFSIGVELEWKRIKTLGKSIFFITIFEALGAFFVVTIVTYIIWKNLPLSLILGSISSATAPAATVSVIQQYKAKGPLTTTILAVIGIDDAISFIIFAFALTITKGYLKGEHINFIDSLINPMKEIFFAVLLGAVIGILAGYLLSRTKEQENGIFILGSAIFIVTGFAQKIDVSELLANMACGIVLINLHPKLKPKIRNVFTSFMPVFYALFFILGGAYLNVSSFPAIWLLALIYFLCRALGKSIGASLGAQIGNALPQVKKYIGLSLLPQVGAAIALALVIQQEFGTGTYGTFGRDLASKTMNILLISTFLTEFIGPYLTKLSLYKSGEAKE